MRRGKRRNSQPKYCAQDRDGVEMSDKPADEFHAFTSLMDKLQTVPKETVSKPVEAYQKEAELRESGPSPKRKPKPLTSPEEARRFPRFRRPFRLVESGTHT